MPWICVEWMNQEGLDQHCRCELSKELLSVLFKMVSWGWSQQWSFPPWSQGNAPQTQGILLIWFLAVPQGELPKCLRLPGLLVDKEGGSTEHAGWTLSSVEGRPGPTSVAPWPSSALGEAVIPYPVDSSPEPRSDGHGSLLKILKSTSPCCSENVSLQDSESRMYLEPLFSLYGSSSGRQQGTGARWHATWKEIPKPLPLCRLTLCSTSWLSWCQKDTPQRCFSVSWAGFQLGRQVVVCLSLDLPRNTWFPPWQPNLPHVLLLLVN